MWYIYDIDIYLESGTAICLHNFLDICLHKLQWNTVSIRNINIQYFPNPVRYTFVFANQVYMNNSREFTHRVKSVSMAKFTAEEAAALQAGGNEVFMIVLSCFLNYIYIHRRTYYIHIHFLVITV